MVKSFNNKIRSKHILENNSAWSLRDVIKRLCKATDILLHEKDYDGQGYEEMELCLKLAKENNFFAKDIASLVKEDIEKRIEKGVEIYGERLRVFNGRNALQDAYEEALDLVLYMKQFIEENKTFGV